MADGRRTLFQAVTAEDKLHPDFVAIRDSAAAEPARLMLDDIFQGFQDPDGNFLEQFQTTGFDSRYFELYLFAYLSRSGYNVDRERPNPDFLASREGVTVAIEATTVNPSTSGALATMGKKISELSEEEILKYQQNELPIRFGSPLFSKLQKKYWELDHCRSLPFVIAIEAFHDDEAQLFSSTALAQYAYGKRVSAVWDQGSTLKIETADVKEHELGSKKIPSSFFDQPDAQHISAILFTNSGTHAKFLRMGYQTGFGCDVMDISRFGFCFNADPNAMDPTFFSYNLDEPPLVESWGQGLVVLHNPTCLRSIAHDFFTDAVQVYIEDGKVKSDHVGWDPISSKTVTKYLGEVKRKIPAELRQTGRLAVGAIPRDEFRGICGFAVAESNPIAEEQGWFSDETLSFLGVVVRDKVDGDWSYVVLARDQYFRFRAIKVESGLPSRYQARMKLQLEIASMASGSQRIFPQ